MTNSSEHFLKLQSYLTKESVFFSSGGIPFHPLLHILNVRHQRLSSRVLGKMLLFWKALLGIRLFLLPQLASIHFNKTDSQWSPTELGLSISHFSMSSFSLSAIVSKLSFSSLAFSTASFLFLSPLFLFLESYFASELNGFWVFKRFFKKRASFSLWQKQLFLFWLVFFLSPNKTKLNLLSNGTLFSWLWVPNPYFLKLGMEMCFYCLEMVPFCKNFGQQIPS